jgi:hypothetical protein
MVAIAVTVVLVVASYYALMEAYGPGPPYFGRTANMDKWSDPLPVLLLVDSIGLLVACILTRFGLRLAHSEK